MNQNTGFRPCTARLYKNGEWKSVTGLFHCWGVDYEEFQVGAGNFTVAVIELPNGEVVTCAADKVVFLDRKEEFENLNKPKHKESGVWIVHDQLFSKWVECGNCGFQIPIRTRADLESVIHTERCPLCRTPISEYRNSDTGISY